jgi:DNA modification methylase
MLRSIHWRGAYPAGIGLGAMDGGGGVMLALPEWSVSTLDTVHCMDAISLLKALPSNYVNCVVTSPPYWGLRDYGVPGQIGLEPTMHEFIDKMVILFREVRRVLRDDGTLWLNLGDSYSTSPKGNPGDGLNGQRFGANEHRYDKSKSPGLKPKDLCGIPWRVALALQDDGWWLRSDIIWHKPNPMPESVTDRPTKAHEYIFLLTKSANYWYDADAVREDAQDRPFAGNGNKTIRPNNTEWHDNRYAPGASGYGHNPADRNKRTVWTVATQPYSAAHFATYPMALIDPCVKAGCPPQVCVECGAPWERVVDYQPHYEKRQSRGEPLGVMPQVDSSGWKQPKRDLLGWRPTCNCHAPTRPGIVYDPFMGAGTTALVAIQNGRHYLGSELNPEYVQMARQRIAEFDPFQPVEHEAGITQLSLFAEAAK